MFSNPFFITSLIVSIAMLAVALLSRWKVLLLIFVLLEGSFVGLVSLFGLSGFRIALTLLFPTILAYFALALCFRTRSSVRVALLVFVCLSSGISLLLNAAIILPVVFENPSQIYSLDIDFSMYLFLASGVLIVVSAGVLALVTGLSMALIRSLSQRKR